MAPPKGSGEVAQLGFLWSVADEREMWERRIWYIFGGVVYGFGVVLYRFGRVLGRKSTVLPVFFGVEQSESAEKEGEIFHRIEAADVSDHRRIFGPGKFRVGDWGGVVEAVDVDAVGDDNGALWERAEGGEFVEDRLGGNDERVGVFVQFALERPVPFGVGLEGVDGVDEFWRVRAILFEAAVGEGGEEVGVDEHGVEGVGFLLFEELGELLKSARGVEGVGHVEGVDGDFCGGELLGNRRIAD